MPYVLLGAGIRVGASVGGKRANGNVLLLRLRWRKLLHL